MGEHRFRCGDTVKHGPSDETWEVAYADYERGKMSWAGWPEGMADIADCTLVEAVDDYQHTCRSSVGGRAQYVQ